MSRGGPATPAVEAGATFSRHTAIYAIGNFIGLSLALVNAIVLTLFLAPSEYGTLGLAMVSASLLTVALNVPLAYGAMQRSFGSTGEEDDDDDALQPKGRDGRRSFGSALIATAGVGAVLAVGGGAVGLGAFGGGETAAIIALVGLSGGAGAMWRLLVAVLRIHRRPVAYVVLTSVRPALVLGASLAFVASGGEVLGAVAGVAVGSVLATAIAALVVRWAYVRALDPNELRMMWRTSRRYFPLIAGFWIVLNADLYVVAAFGSTADVGEYRLASRLGALASYGTSAMVSAWAPLERGKVFEPADEVHGRDVVRGRLLFFFLLLCVAMALTLAVAADALVRLAPDDYAAAATLLPLLGLAFVAHGAVVGVYRATQYEGRAPRYRRAVLRSGLVYVPVAVGLVALIGARGAAIGAAFVLGVLAVVMAGRAARAGRPIVMAWERLAAATAAAIGLYVVTLLMPDSEPALATAADVAAPFLFVVAALAIMPAGHRALLWRVLRATVR